QREYVERMIDLIFPGAGAGEAYKPVSNLAMFKLRSLRDKLAGIVDDKSAAGKLDPYTLAHLSEARVRIEKPLAASYVYNARRRSGLTGVRPRPRSAGEKSQRAVFFGDRVRGPAGAAKDAPAFVLALDPRHARLDPMLRGGANPRQSERGTALQGHPGPCQGLVRKPRIRGQNRRVSRVVPRRRA